MPEGFHYGGQAVIEGVLIRGRSGASLAVRRPDQTIETRNLPIPGWATSRWRMLPLVRGIVVFVETLVVGMQALTVSATISSDEGGDDQPISGIAIAVTIGLALIFGVGLFFLVPLFLSKLVEGAGSGSFLANVAEGGFRLAAFIGYIYLISLLKDVRRVLAYHGAEHMTIAASEAGAPLDIVSIRGFPKAHPRCGTAFLLTVMVVSIVVFMLIPRHPLWMLISSRILLVPVIAAVSYEIIRYSGRHPRNVWVRLITSPNLLLQALTTRVPEDDQIEVAIAALNAAVAADQSDRGRTAPVTDTSR